MSWVTTALWGLLGGGLIVGLDFATVVTKLGDWPWRARKKMRAAPYLTANAIRLLLGAGLAAAAGESGLVPNPLMAVTVGVATPLIVEKLSRVGAELTGAPGGPDRE